MYILWLLGPFCVGSARADTTAPAVNPFRIYGLNELRTNSEAARGKQRRHLLHISAANAAASQKVPASDRVGTICPEHMTAIGARRPRGS